MNDKDWDKYCVDLSTPTEKIENSLKALDDRIRILEKIVGIVNDE